MNVLMIYPECCCTFWSNHHLLDLFNKKGNMPPLGLLTVAGLLSDEYNKKVVDMNCESLCDEDIIWADYVFVSAMIVQKDSSKAVIKRCSEFDVKIVAGGPLFTSLYPEYPEVDHFIFGESELIISRFFDDVKNGSVEKFYSCDELPDLKKSPIPRYDLIDMNNYLQIALQTTRGCPFDCEFCEITSMNGRVPRYKTPEQVIAELDYAMNLGWGGRVFFVDDNFIGNKHNAKEVLKRIIEWRKETGFKGLFFTELSLNAVDDEELLELLCDAGFYMVFVGIETPSLEGLNECGKIQNKNRDMIQAVRKFYKYGIKVAGGFIVGFDSDDETIFDKQLSFIQKAGIPLAMIGMLNALPNTRLLKRLTEEGRISDHFMGSNTDFTTNIVPKMGLDNLVEGYKNLIKTAYSPKMYYERITNLIKYYNPVIELETRKSFMLAGALTIYKLGVLSEGRRYFWKFVLINLIRYPKSFFWGIESAVSYVHFYKMYKEMSAITVNS